MLELFVYFLIWRIAAGHVACIHKYVRIRKGLSKNMVIISVNQKFNEIIFKFIENSTSESPGHPGRKTCRSPIPLDYRKRRLNWEMGGGGLQMRLQKSIQGPYYSRYGTIKISSKPVSA